MDVANSHQNETVSEEILDLAPAKEGTERVPIKEYPTMRKYFGCFQVEIKSGEFTDSEIIVVLGEKETGKTTFLRMLAGKLVPDEGGKLPKFNVSYKPQNICRRSYGTVRQMLHEKINDNNLRFITEVILPMQVEQLFDKKVMDLSDDEMQRVALTICLGKNADVYLIDEPSTYLDTDQRICVAKVIKQFILNTKKTAFVVEHDAIMTTYLADRVIIFEGHPSVANAPQIGLNKLLW